MGQRGVVARLLSRRNQMSRLEKEAILERVLATVAPDNRRRARRAWLAVCIGLGAAVTLTLFLVLPRPETFTARGGGEAPSFRLRCVDGSVETGCHAGAKLVFEVVPGAATPYFAAFARRGDGTVIWYFPDGATGKSKDLSRDLVRGILDSGILLGPEHAPGSYEVFGIFSARPFDRAEVKTFVGAPDQDGAVLVEQRMTVE